MNDDNLFTLNKRKTEDKRLHKKGFLLLLRSRLQPNSKQYGDELNENTIKMKETYKKHFFFLPFFVPLNKTVSIVDNDFANGIKY